MNANIAGGMINAALFLLVLAAAGLVVGNHLVVILVLASSAVAVLSYEAMAFEQSPLGHVLAVTSQLLALVAFGALFVGYLRS